MSKFAWVTLTTNDTYCLGALVMAHSLRRAGTAHQLAVMVTPGVSESMRDKLKDVYNVVQEVNVMDSQDAANLALLARPELGITFTKLHCWRLVQFEKCVFLDCDTLILQNCDELFEREELSAAPDVSWPDCFNSGVFVYRPSLDTFGKITDFALKHGSFDGGDQGLLNLYFPDWAHKDISKHLPFIYNVTAYAAYCYLPAFKQFKDKIKILHFAGKMKPWLIQFNSQTRTVCTPSEYHHASDLIQLWWNIFCDKVHQILSEQMPPQHIISENFEYHINEEAGLAGALSSLRLGETRTPEQDAYEQLMRRQCWEAGQIDYCGKDSFDNIWKKITETLEAKPSATKSEQDDKSERLFSCDIEDGRVEIDSATGARTEYKLIDGGYEMIITTKQPNGTVKTQVKTFYDPKPVTEEDLAKQNANKKIIKNKASSLAKLDRNTTMVTREIPGGYEEVYTTVNNDGTKSIRTKTFYDAVQEEITDESTKVQTPKKKTTTTAKTSKDEVDESHRMQKLETNKKTNVMKRIDSEEYNIKHQSTFEETRTHTQKTEISGTNTSIRKNSIQEQSTRAISTSSDTKKDTKKLKRNKSIPPPPPDFIENESTTVTSKKIRGGVEYTYSTTLESGQTITTTKTVFQEEEVDMTEEEINQYKKVLKDAEKHKNVTGTKKLKSDSGTKKVVPSENPGDVTTVETIKIEGGTEYHYTTVTAEGIVKKATKTIYDPVPVKASPDESDEEEIVEEYEEEVIEPGDKTVRTIEHTKTLPKRFEEEITITKEKKEKKVKKSMMISQ